MPARSRAELIETLRGTLIDAAHPPGGWPYYAGKRPRIEATCWTLLALAGTHARDATAWPSFASPHLRFLGLCQQPDGTLIDDTPHLPNFASNGLAVCAVAALAPTEGPALTRLVDGIAAVRGVSAENAPDLRQDNTLRAWPWMPGTFSWLEPSAWCLLALKKMRTPARPAVEARIQEADKLIANRSCVSGGWNFGNASALGQDLRPYVPTTALALIALQDRRSDPVVEHGLSFLKGARLNEPSAMALALTALCLRIYGLPADDVESRLADDANRALRMGNVQAIAMMLYALSGSEHGAKALRI